MNVVEMAQLLVGRTRVKKKPGQATLLLLAVLLFFRPGLASDGPQQMCRAQGVDLCSKPCSYLRTKCGGDRECSVDLCSYIYSVCYPRMDCSAFLHDCWQYSPLCGDAYADDYKASKRGILNKNVAYLLLKLHPFLNQTSQFGFLTANRNRRITGNFGTEFLGKRNDDKSNGSNSSETGNSVKAKTKTKFYSFPKNKFSQMNILKRGNDFPPELGKRITIRGNGRVIVGSEFLGKREFPDTRMKKLMGSELLGKRNPETYDGSEFLGKRGGNYLVDGSEFLGKRSDEDLLAGSELLGKKSSKEHFRKPLGKRYSTNELFGKRFYRQTAAIWTEDDPELIDEAFSNYRLFPKAESSSLPDCGKRSCRREITAGEQQTAAETD